MRRVVVTGMGIVSSIGTNKAEVLESLRAGRSGIEFSEEYRSLGFRSQVHGPIRVKREELIERKLLRFMGDAAAFTYIAMAQAIADSGLPGSVVSQRAHRPDRRFRRRIAAEPGRGRRIAAQQGRASASGRTWCRAACRAPPRPASRRRSISRASTIRSASACATSAHCIGNACEQIQWGKQDIVFAGGCEELRLDLVGAVRRHGRLSSKYNDTPAAASPRLRQGSRRLRHRRRRRRGGAGGARARRARGAKIYAEIVGYARQFRRLRHGRALGRGRGALHAHGAGAASDTADRLSEPARHRHADRRREGDGRRARGVRRQACR